MLQALTESKKFKHIGSQLKEEGNIDLVLHYLDDNKVNLWKYVQMCMLDFAWKECSEGVLLPPNRI